MRAGAAAARAEERGQCAEERAERRPLAAQHDHIDAGGSHGPSRAGGRAGAHAFGVTEQCLQRHGQGGVLLEQRDVRPLDRAKHLPQAPHQSQRYTGSRSAAGGVESLDQAGRAG
eukprot:scaffold5825_cov130-Isochrysis_galbana.AAC.5